MSYNILVIPPFDRQFKRLSKKHPSLKKDITLLVHSLESNPLQGISLGNNCRKIRLAITSKGKGKSSGARIITHLHVIKSAVYLLNIYDKAEQEDITEYELTALLKHIP